MCKGTTRRNAATLLEYARPPMCEERALLSQSEACNDLLIPFPVRACQVLQQVRPLADHLQQPAARRVVLLMALEMVRQLRDPFGQQRNLDLGRPGVALMPSVGRHDLMFPFQRHRHDVHHSTGPFPAAPNRPLPGQSSLCSIPTFHTITARKPLCKSPPHGPLTPPGRPSDPSPGPTATWPAVPEPGPPVSPSETACSGIRPPRASRHTAGVACRGCP